MADSATAIAGARRTSGWAIMALGTSLAVFCPVLTLIGPLLAVRALVQIRANPDRTGRGMALAALWIGLIATATWIVLLFWWNGHVRSVMLHGPQVALQQGMAGDLEAFKRAFVHDALPADDARTSAFLAQLRSRYGTLVSVNQDVGTNAPPPGAGRSVAIPYVMTFDRSTLKADVQMLLFARGLAPRFESIHIKDGQRGDLTFP